MTDLEMYAARCGTLHTLTPFADLHGRNPEIRVLGYVDQLPTGLDAIVDPEGKTNLVIVSMRAMFRALLSGIRAYRKDIASDSKIRLLVEEGFDRLFVPTPFEQP